MEEKKFNAKEVKMATPSSEKGEQAQKYSYEQLNNICNQLYQQNQNLVKQLQQLNMVNMFKRLDYLFKVVELSNGSSVYHFNKEFVNDCIAEIEESMTPVPEEENAQREEGEQQKGS